MHASLMVKYLSNEARKHAPFALAKPGDCGYDLYNAAGRALIIEPGSTRDIPAGLALKIPDGYCGLIRPRSSTFAERHLLVIHSVIDSGYVGPLFTCVWHPGIDGHERYAPIIVEPWERLSQILILPIPKLDIKLVDELPETERGDSGWGSTGR